MSYTYLVHMKAYRADGQTDLNVDIFLPKPITSMTMVREVERAVREKNGFQKCLLVNFILLQGPEPAACQACTDSNRVTRHAAQG